MLLATLAVVACGRDRNAPPPERFVPASARVAVVLPELGRAASALAALHGSLSGLPGAGDRVGWRRALAAQLGFDPLDPAGLEGAGLDPKRGAALAFVAPSGGGGSLARSAALLVLPVADESAVEKLLAALARDRLGATERTTAREGGIATTRFRRPGSASAALTYAIVERSALVATDADGAAVIAAAATLTPPASMGADAGWTRVRAALGDGLTAAVWAPPGSPALPPAWGLGDGVAVGVAPSAGRLVARVVVPLGTREPTFRALAGGGRAATLAGALDPDAPLLLRWDGDFAALGKLLVPRLPARDREALARAGVDLERDLFGVLQPGGAAALSLAPRAGPGSLSADALRRDPLGLVEAEGVAPVGPGAEAALARLARALGVKDRRPRADGISRIRYGDGELAWKLDAGQLAVAGGRPGRLDALLARLASGAPGWKAPSEASGAALAGGLGGAVLDVPRLVAAVRALPDEAYGGGPSAFVARSLAERVLEPAQRVAAVSLRAELAEGSLVVTVEIEPAPATPGGGGPR
ncbi:MAG TPA: hypothetical protein VF875_02310 [Anaeromyxobacter sp.]